MSEITIVRNALRVNYGENEDFHTKRILVLKVTTQCEYSLTIFPQKCFLNNSTKNASRKRENTVRAKSCDVLVRDWFKILIHIHDKL